MNYTTRYNRRLFLSSLFFGLLMSPLIVWIVDGNLSSPAFLYKLAWAVPVMTLSYAVGFLWLLPARRISLPPGATGHLRQDLHKLGYRPLEQSALIGTYAVPGTNGRTVLHTIEVEWEANGSLRVQGPKSQIRELEKLWEVGTEQRLE